MTSERLRVLKVQPKPVSMWLNPPAWVAPALTLCAIALSLASTLVAFRGLSSYSRQNLHAHQITACSNLVVNSHLFVLNVATQCTIAAGSIDCNPVVGFMPSTTPSVLAATHPAMLALAKYLDTLAAIDLVVPNETPAIKKLTELAKGMIQMKMDPAGTTVLDRAIDHFTSLNAQLFRRCKLVTRGGA